jgi:DHA2 family multidrug resistance protein
VFDPATTERLAAYQSSMLGKGFDLASATDASNRLMELAVTRQGFLLAYLDGFLLISIFFLAALPFVFLLKTKRMDKATAQKIAEESH